MAYRQSSENPTIDLLRSIITEEKWSRFQRTGTLEIQGKAGIYRVGKGEPTRLLDSGTGCSIAAIRWQPASAGTERDRLVAEYLLIRNDENRYWETAKLLPDRSGSNLYFSLLVAALDVMLLMVLLAQFH